MFHQAEKEAEQLVSATPHKTFLANQLICSLCGQEVEMERLRVKSKREQTFKCLTCDTRISQLRRLYGGWPSPEFAGRLNDASRKQFYVELHAKGSQSEIRAYSEEKMSEYENHEEHYAENGNDNDETAGECGHSNMHGIVHKTKSP